MQFHTVAILTSTPSDTLAPTSFYVVS